MNGGPATIDLWDLKPGHEHGGPFRPIQTAAPGLQISEHLPRLAGHGDHLAVVRSITSPEGEHGRARQFVHTGYLPQPAIRFPQLGSLVAHGLQSDSGDLPAFVSIGPEPALATSGSGFLGPSFAPMVIGGPGGDPSSLLVSNLTLPEHTSTGQRASGLQMLGDLDDRFARERVSSVLDTIQAASRKAIRMMQPEAAAAFDLSQESQADRDRYGTTMFGQGCLMARRLIEQGVRFVEVCLDGWDTHNNNFVRVQQLSQTLDLAFASLLDDLRQRGRLESTLVVCLGEFGRTPKINGNTGRDHWPGSWAAAMSGGGIRGGQAIGATSDDGMTVTDRPVTIPDLIATICQTLDIDPKSQNTSDIGRPIRVADPEAKVIAELLS